MELKDFITNTLVQLAVGIRAANATLENAAQGAGGVRYRIKSSSDFPNEIAFDIALTTTETGTTKGGGEIRVWSVGVGGGKEKQSASEVVSRISFKVAVADTLA
jgi:hypothetical protein